MMKMFRTWTLAFLLLLFFNPAESFLAPITPVRLSISRHGIPPVQRVQDPTALGMVASAERRRFLDDTFRCASLLLIPSSSALVVRAEEQDSVYENSKSGFRLAYPAGWKESKKPVQTHQDEIQFKSTATKGTEVGVTVDPVKIDSVAQFGTPKEVGKRVMGVERARDGVLSAKFLGSSEVQYDGVPYYTIEYESESTRGNKHFIACVAINKKKLYVVTGQAKQDSFKAEEENLRRTVASFRLTQAT